MEVLSKHGIYTFKTTSQTFTISQRAVISFHVKPGTNILHHETEPALITQEKEISYYLNGDMHRVDGPAHIFPYSEAWYLNDKLHRLNGPAYTLRKINNTVVYTWWINGVQLSQEKQKLLNIWWEKQCKINTQE